MHADLTGEVGSLRERLEQMEEVCDEWASAERQEGAPQEGGEVELEEEQVIAKPLPEGAVSL